MRPVAHEARPNRIPVWPTLDYRNLRIRGGHHLVV